MTTIKKENFGPFWDKRVPDHNSVFVPIFCQFDDFQALTFAHYISG